MATAQKRTFYRDLRSTIARRAKVINTYCTPVFLIPLLTKGTKEAKCAYGLFLMFNSWVFETIPAPMTSSLPFVLLPLLDIMAPDDVALQYLNDTFLFVLSVMLIAMAIEATNLYNRISLTMLSRLGTGVKSVFTGVVVLSCMTTLVLTSSTATLVVFPIVESTIAEIECDNLTSAKRKRMRRKASVQARLSARMDDEGSAAVLPSATNVPTQDSKAAASERRPSRKLSIAAIEHLDAGVYGLARRVSVISEDFASKFEREFKKYQHIKETLLLSVVYCTTLGSIGSLYANSSSRILFRYLEERYSYKSLSFLTWLCLCAPVSAASVFTCWIVIFDLFLKEYDCAVDEETRENIEAILEEKYRFLGSVTKSEIFVVAVTILLFTAVLLIQSSSAGLFGWRDATSVLFANDTTCVFVVVLLFFALPQNPKNDLFEDTFLEWALVQQKIPWSIFLTYGGGLCMATAFQKSGLALLVTDGLAFMKGWNPIIVQFVLMLVTSLLTEVNNDAATATVLIPIACDLADSSHVNPLYYTFPVTAASCTGMLLPVASVPMALAYGTLENYQKCKMVGCDKKDIRNFASTI
ncbi:sodium-dependent low-affinity dicarboxylate transporter 1-like isoform X2 [Ornithodoros turicata]|uniref:sodium-dependent low-affinity dicarboxylate transporter 1-like isoform X2 n=1 Tax=Ornithodoros turicata TaxID=34597 RepID=UPI00313887FA